MARLWLYGIVAADAGTPAATGVCGEPLSVCRRGAVAAVHGCIDDLPGVTAAALRRHDRVVEELRRQAGAVVPVRFGETFADAAGLERVLESRAEDLHDRLADLRGRVQMTLRVFAVGDRIAPAPSPPSAPPAVPDVGPGTAYLLQRRRARSRAATLPEVEELRRALRPLVARERIVRLDAGRLLGTAYDLVAESTVDRYRSTVAEHAADSAAYRLALSGPRAPWAFAAGLTSAAQERR